MRQCELRGELCCVVVGTSVVGSKTVTVLCQGNHDVTQRFAVTLFVE